MGNIKFEEAWSLERQDIISISGLHELWISNGKCLPNEHRMGLICPECRLAHLIYYSAPTPHLQTKPGSVHDSECGLKQIPVRYRAFKAMYDDLECHDVIENAMRRFHNYRMNKHDIEKGNNPFIIDIPRKIRYRSNEEKNTENYVRSQSPRKNIRNILDDENLGIVKIFYGEFQIKWKKVINQFDKEEMELQLTLPQYPNVLYTIRMSMLVFNHTNALTNNDNEFCHVYVTTSFTKRNYKNDMIYFNGRIKTSKLLLIHSVEQA